MVFGDASTGEKLALGGGGIALVGSLLPWLSSDLIGGPGIDGGREIAVLLCCFVLFGLIYLGEWEKPVKVATAGLGGAILLLAGYTVAEGFELIGNVNSTVGVGVYLSILGAVLILVGAYQGYADRTPEAGMYSHRR